MYCLDTNTIIYFLKGQGNVSKKLFSKQPSQITIPSLVVFELEYGVKKSAHPRRNQNTLEEFLRPFSVLPFDEKVANIAAKIRYDLGKIGTPIGPIDTLIAATAMANDKTLVTHNVKEFKRVKGLKDEDWF